MTQRCIPMAIVIILGVGLLGCQSPEEAAVPVDPDLARKAAEAKAKLPPEAQRAMSGEPAPGR